MLVLLGNPITDGDTPREKEIVLDDFDTWNVNTTAATLLVPLLQQFRDQRATKGSTWCSLVDDPLNATEDEWDAAHKKQFELIDDMIFAFEAYAGETDARDDDPRVVAGLEAFAKYFRNLWN